MGLFLDLAIRNATKNSKSLDDVMRYVYWKYYKAGRGFSDAEFQQACEETAGVPLTEVFEYVNTTKDLDYAKYLGYGGLKLSETTTSSEANVKKKFSILRIDNPDSLQVQILSHWQGEK